MEGAARMTRLLDCVQVFQECGAEDAVNAVVEEVTKSPPSFDDFKRFLTLVTSHTACQKFASALISEAVKAPSLYESHAKDVMLLLTQHKLEGAEQFLLAFVERLSLNALRIGADLGVTFGSNLVKAFLRSAACIEATSMWAKLWNCFIGSTLLRTTTANCFC